MFLSIIDMYSHEFEANNMDKLIISETAIFDVLHQFFYHSNFVVRRASLEVYVRRAYISYDMIALQHHLIDGSSSNESSESPERLDSRIPTAVFHFLLPSSHPSMVSQPLDMSNSKTHLNDFGNFDESAYQSNYRVGIIAAFKNLDHAEVFVINSPLPSKYISNVSSILETLR